MLSVNPFFNRWGRFSYYLLSSGLIERLGGFQYGNTIKLPHNKDILILRSKDTHKKQKYENKDLSIILFDGIEEYLGNQSLFEELSNNKLSFYYVGKFDKFWKKVPNSFQLYPFNTYDDFLYKQISYSKLYSKLYFQRNRQLLVTINNSLKKPKIFSEIFFGKPKYVYFGNIKPSNSLIKYYKNFGINEEHFISFCNDTIEITNLDSKIKLFCEIKDIYLSKFIIDKPHIIISFINLLLRNLIVNLIKTNKKVLVYDGQFKGTNFFNAYQCYGGIQHTYIDFGSKLGFDTIYPRIDDIFKYKKKYLYIKIDENFILMNKLNSHTYLYKLILNFIKKLI